MFKNKPYHAMLHLNDVVSLAMPPEQTKSAACVSPTPLSVQHALLSRAELLHAWLHHNVAQRNQTTNVLRASRASQVLNHDSVVRPGALAISAQGS